MCKVNTSRQMKAENPGEIKGHGCLTQRAVAKLNSHPAPVNPKGPEEEPPPPFAELAELIPLHAASITLRVFSRCSNLC